LECLHVCPDDNPHVAAHGSWGVDTPKSSLLPHGSTTLLFGFQFALGRFLHRQPHLLEHSACGWWKPMLLGAAMVWVWPTDPGVEWLQHLGIDSAHTTCVRLPHAALCSLMMRGFMLGFLGAFVRFRRRPSASWRHIADASYWNHIAHLPLVV
jgi:hypothetical protein